MFVPGFEQDVFVSYSHLDDEPIAPGQKGWVARLVAALEREVGQRLGAPSFRIWWDPQLAGNVPLTQELVGRLRGAATLLTVVSPAYLASSWCAKERNAFLSFARDCVADGRIFLVRCRQPEAKLPVEFGDLAGFPFIRRDAQTGIERPLGAFEPPEPEYWDQLIRLGAQLADRLKALKAEREQEQASAPALLPCATPSTFAPAVFVARSTDDLGDREEELKGYLEQQGLRLLPRTGYPDGDATAFRAAMDADLRSCKVFAQVVSANPGRRVEPSSELRYPLLQHEAARARGLPVLQWRPPALDLRTVEDLRQRELLDGARACGFEEFKRAVVDEFRRPPPVSRPPVAAGSETLAAFLDADARDLALADEVGTLLEREGIEAILPALSGPPDAVRKDFEEHLLACEGLLLVYGSSEPLWVRSQMLQIRKIASQRERPFSVLALFMGPPPEKGELGLKLPNVVTLDCRAGVQPEAIHAFAQALRRPRVTA